MGDKLSLHKKCDVHENVCTFAIEIINILIEGFRRALQTCRAPLLFFISQVRDYFNDK